MSGRVEVTGLMFHMMSRMVNDVMRMREQSVGSFDFKAYYDNEAFSDVTIKFGGQEIKCHKLILCTKSEYFNKQFGHSGQFAESKKREISLHEDPPEAVEAMLSELYTFDYNEKFSEIAWCPSFHLKVNVTARKYLLDELAGKSFAALVRTTAAAHGNLDVIKDLLDSHQQYKGGHDDLDQHVALVLKNNLSRLMSVPEYREPLLEDEEICQEVIHRLATIENSLESSGKYIIRCAHCSHADHVAPPTARLECCQCHRVLQEGGTTSPDGQRLKVWLQRI